MPANCVFVGRYRLRSYTPPCYGCPANGFSDKFQLHSSG
jgi:hypothetical protein